MEPKIALKGDWIKDYNAATQVGTKLPTAAIRLSYDGTAQHLPEAEFAQYDGQHFTSLSFEYSQLFVRYFDEHCMADLKRNLTTGMDDLSCEYVERFCNLSQLCRLDGKALVNVSEVWTQADRDQMQRYLQCKAAGTPPLLQNVDLTWGTSFINCYGLYDVPADKLAPINGKAVIDAGGFIGDSITIFRARFPQSPVHSFEPLPQNFAYLARLFARDSKRGLVVPVNKALGATAETLKLTHMDNSDKFYANSSLLFDYEGSIAYDEVEVITLDDYVQEHDLSVGLIKMDVEGFEPQIVQGALATIKRDRPVMTISIYHTPEEFFELKPFLERLDLGYKFQIRHSSLIMPLGDLVLVAYPED